MGPDRSRKANGLSAQTLSLPVKGSSVSEVRKNTKQKQISLNSEAFSYTSWNMLTPIILLHKDSSRAWTSACPF